MPFPNAVRNTHHKAIRCTADGEDGLSARNDQRLFGKETQQHCPDPS